MQNVVTSVSTGIVPPVSEAEHVAFLIRVGDLAAAYQLQEQQRQEGRWARRIGEPFLSAAPAAWQAGWYEGGQSGK